MTNSNPPDWMRPHGRSWRALAERPVYDNPWITVTEYDAEAPTGARTIYGVVGFKKRAIGVLPIHADGTVVLVGQQRFPTGEYSWEIPEGGVPVGDDPLEGAKRELREETGLIAAEWRLALTYQLSNSVTDERGSGYIATGLTAAEAMPDATEDLAVARTPFREALDQAMSGRIEDAITLAMLLRAYHMAREGDIAEPLASAMLGSTGETP